MWLHGQFDTVHRPTRNRFPTPNQHNQQYRLDTAEIPDNAGARSWSVWQGRVAEQCCPEPVAKPLRLVWQWDTRGRCGASDDREGRSAAARRADTHGRDCYQQIRPSVWEFSGGNENDGNEWNMRRFFLGRSHTPATTALQSVVPS